MKKYKYYFRKPRSEIVKDILTLFFVSGAFMVAATSPYFGVNVWRVLKNRKKYPKRKFTDTFTRLYRKGFISIERQGHEVRISLTPEGRKAAGYMQINDLRIPRPKKWDGIWHIIIFDISNLKTIQRNAFRGILKQLGFVMIQKSVWVQPFPCSAEIELLKDFFGLTEKEVRLIEAKKIGNDTYFRKKFGL